MKTAIIEPYGWQLNICLGEEEARRFRDKHWPEGYDEDGIRKASLGYMAFCGEAPRDKRWLMMLPPGLCHSILAHEALHCAIMMMEESGQIADQETQEGLAYSQGHIMDLILKKCWPAECQKERTRRTKAAKFAHKEKP